MIQKLKSLEKRAKKEGVLSTAGFVASKLVRFAKTGQVTTTNTVGENLERWSKWDWSAQGEEWTPDTDWKMSLVKNVLEPSVPVGSRVLEIGPGGGRWTEFLAKRATHLTIVDLTPECIQFCKNKFKDAHNISYFVNDGRDLSFVPTQSVDRIWSFDVFVHIDAKDIENYVRQFSSILAKGGSGVIHHSAKGVQKTGWRSNMTAQLMLEQCAKHGLRVTRQFTSWENNRFHIRPDSPENSMDVITAFEKAS